MTRSHRQTSIRLISDRSVSVSPDAHNWELTRNFGQDVFTDEVMKRLPKPIRTWGAPSTMGQRCRRRPPKPWPMGCAPGPRNAVPLTILIGFSR